MSYKDSLNLPSTTFPMKANLANMEPKILNFWKDLDIYHKLQGYTKGRKKFILHDGPPYANGPIHIGHALNKILKDVVIKFKIMTGHDCPYIVGWDCHGLPVEHQLFKELKLSKSDVDVPDFREKAKTFALKFVETQKEDFKRLGIFSNWDKPYLTLSKDYEFGVVSLLGDLTKKGYVYRGRKPVNWCSRCETALAEAEVEYADKSSESIYFLFKAQESKALAEYKNLFFLVWTTTPWTLISNVAVAVHPDLDYGLYEYKDKVIILACDLKETVQAKANIVLKELKIVKGHELEGITLSHPFIERNSGVVNADYVSKEDGSGCVHIAPGHGQEDFSLVKKYNLDIIMPVNEKGCFDETVGDFSGKNIKQTNISVIEKLTENDRLLHHEKISHSYPHCWRCKTPIIFRATYQWFLNIDHQGLREKLVSATKDIRWIPESGIERMKGMLLTRPDWCLSRQRFWGIPIPAIKCSCGEISLDCRVIEKTANIFKEEGSGAWFAQDVEYFLPEGFVCPKCGGKDFSKEKDILDVWFESGSSFMSVVKNDSNLSYPSDMYLEGSDQHRGWFQASLIPSVASLGQAPFKAILTHGFVVDGDGKKMSKSLGNVISPQAIIKRYGAEILRLWVISGDYSGDIKISETIIKQLADMYRKIRNTIRFIMGNLYDFDPKNDYIEPKDLVDIDRYMLSKTSVFLKEVTADYEDCNFHKVCQEIFNFCNLDLSSFYLDILKDKLYTNSPKSHQRKSAQNALYHILKSLIKVVAPVLSFTAEEAFSCFGNWQGKKESIYMHELATPESGYFDSELVAVVEKILGLRSEVLKEVEKKRESGVVGSSLEAEVKLQIQKSDYDFYKKYEDLLREIFIVSTVSVEQGDFKIDINKASGEKCQRCWNFRCDVGNDNNYPDVCSRCANALKIGG